VSKLVVLKLDGNLEQGVRVTLEIGDQNARPFTEVTAQLPPAPDLLATYDRWHSTYRSLGKSVRIKAKQITYDGSISQRREDCRQLEAQLRSQLNSWLLSESFRSVRDRLLPHLKLPADEVRLLVSTRCTQLRQIPWMLWDLVEQSPQVEVALSFPDYNAPATLRKLFYRKPVRILAILGNSAGIDLKIDRQLLESLPNAKTTFLENPHSQEVKDYLWDRSWDILFFAGHSRTEGETGRIYINERESLTIAEFSRALSNAVAGGLHLAIFNSCDGLGLAAQLQQAQIPQVIVMREPVPDLVAQRFLKYLLAALSCSKSLYLAVRQARDRLKEDLEVKFPCASWLPVICQNAAVEPMTWVLPETSLNSRQLKNVLLLSVAITASVLGIRLLGGLQAWELQAYDSLMRSRPDERSDPRLLIVTVTEDDLHLPIQKQKTGSLSNLALAQLLDKLVQFKARTIGLDIYRDEPVQPDQASLTTRWRTEDNFFAICKVSDRANNHPGTLPPVGVPPARLGFSDVLQDADDVLRRHLLAMKPAPASPCTAPYALSAQLAFHYLEKENISAKYTASGDLQLGKIVFKRLRMPMGGYQQGDTEGYQILLNYRSYRHSPAEIAPTVTLKAVLQGAVKPEEVRDRIVLIGVTAETVHDYIPTPYSVQQGFYQKMPGVILQAQMVSQIVSAVKDGRPLLTVLPIWGEALWIWSWSLVGGVIAWRSQAALHLILIGGGALGVLYILCLVFLCLGSWVPLIPSALVLVVTGSTVAIYITVRSQQQLSSVTLRHN
jgi:CHASE2 domain-containing sensor protein